MEIEEVKPDITDYLLIALMAFILLVVGFLAIVLIYKVFQLIF